MNITEDNVDDSIADNLEGAAKEGADLIGVSIDRPTLEIVTAINSFVSSPPRKKLLSKKVDNWEDRALWSSPKKVDTNRIDRFVSLSAF